MNDFAVPIPDAVEDFATMDEIIEKKLYLSSVFAAKSQSQITKNGITHILTICDEYPSTGPHHKVIVLDDAADQNLLEHLPGCCDFIQDAIDSGGRVLVHCVMGISRSSTVVAAYLMRMKGLTLPAAIRVIKKKRPFIHPNAGFVKQLKVFAQCLHNPTPSHPIYQEWLTQHEGLYNDTSNRRFVIEELEMATVIPQTLYISSNFLLDADQFASFPTLGIKAVVSLSTTLTSSPLMFPKFLKKHHVKIAESYRYQPDLILALPEICRFIDEVTNDGSGVLVHFSTESRVCLVAAAYLMQKNRISAVQAYHILSEESPLFDPDHNWLYNLDVYESCDYNPTKDHPLIQSWMSKTSKAVASEPLPSKYNELKVDMSWVKL